MAVARTQRVSYPLLWFGFLGAPVAWSVQELVSLSLISHYCYPMGEPLASPYASGIWVIQLLVIIVTAAIAAAALLVAFTRWRALHAPAGSSWGEEMLEPGSSRAADYLQLSGIYLGVLFFVLILYSGVALFVVPLCGYH